MVLPLAPSRMHTLAPSSWLFLALVVIALPYGAIRTARRTRGAAGPALIPSRVRMHWNGVVTHVVLLAVAWVAARMQGLHFLGPVRVTPPDVLAGGVTLGLLGGMAWVSRLIRSEPERQRMWVLGFLPRTWREGVPFAALAAVAAVSEELTYRGVVFTLFAILTGSALVGAVLSGVAFASAHFPQGTKSMGVIFVIALIKQALVAFTQTLWIAIVVHFTYNVLVALRLAGRARAVQRPG